ncbi:hypothetical protein GQ54DRAFT_237781, partial [Martensiomyces pterosporus]
VTKAHWQQFKQGDRCNVPACTLTLGPQTGVANCRRCGRLMCSQHCSHRLRLTPAAQASSRGVDCRVCEECYLRSTDSQRHHGPSRNLTMAFVHLRKRAVSTALLEGNRMEKRLEKLAAVYANASPAGSIILQLPRAKSLQAAEQSVVMWEDDSAVDACPFCHSPFGRLASRRHHCRLCGRVVCGRGSCSTSLSIPLPSDDGAGFSSEHCADVRTCKECEHIVIRHRDRAARMNQAPDALTVLYADVNAFMAQVEDALPTFNALAIRLNDSGSVATPDLPRAARIRRQLTAAFNSLDQTSKRILELPADTPTAKRLHLAIRRAVAQYLQLHMFPLTMLPKPERKVSSASSTTTMNTTEDEVSNQPVLEMPPTPPTAMSMSHHEKLESISVLRDQRERVKGYISEAQRDRRLDDAKSLQMSLNDLEAEL